MNKVAFKGERRVETGGNQVSVFQVVLGISGFKEKKKAANELLRRFAATLLN